MWSDVITRVGAPPDWSITLYINGVAHRITHLGESFFADAPGYPCVRCSQHRIGTSAADAVRAGATVRTLGNTYSLSPPKP